MNTTCRTCGGTGKIRASQGFFTIERTCPSCHGHGNMIDAENARINAENACRELLSSNMDLIEKFLGIAERKVSVIDDYGDENWDALPAEIETCLSKIARRNGVNPQDKSGLPGEYRWFRPTVTTTSGCRTPPARRPGSCNSVASAPRRVQRA